MLHHYCLARGAPWFSLVFNIQLHTLVCRLVTWLSKPNKVNSEFEETQFKRILNSMDNWKPKLSLTHFNGKFTSKDSKRCDRGVLGIDSCKCICVIKFSMSTTA